MSTLSIKCEHPLLDVAREATLVCRIGTSELWIPRATPTAQHGHPPTPTLA